MTWKHFFFEDHFRVLRKNDLSDWRVVALLHPKKYSTTAVMETWVWIPRISHCISCLFAWVDQENKSSGFIIRLCNRFQVPSKSGRIPQKGK